MNLKDGSPAWIRTTIHGSKGRCPTIRRPGIERIDPFSLTAPRRTRNDPFPIQWTRKAIWTGVRGGLQNRSAALGRWCVRFALSSAIPFSASRLRFCTRNHGYSRRAPKAGRLPDGPSASLRAELLSRAVTRRYFLFQQPAPVLWYLPSQALHSGLATSR